ncbi:MAG: hypothetical protein M1816_005577 [Peltula sp. TS41687]|nr:MAG: hypothetical protein M1816_005577 [Peltula sp. TS41687]
MDPPRFRTVVAKIQADAAVLPGLPTAHRAAVKNVLVIAAATLGSWVDKHNRLMKKESADKKSLPLVKQRQSPAALDDSDSDDENAEGGDGDNGDGGNDGGAVGGGSW